MLVSYFLTLPSADLVSTQISLESPPGWSLLALGGGILVGGNPGGGMEKLGGGPGGIPGPPIPGGGGMPGGCCKQSEPHCTIHQCSDYTIQIQIYHLSFIASLSTVR
jgi:hypothetical protein